jgi:hypothetical protein
LHSTLPGFIGVCRASENDGADRHPTDVRAGLRIVRVDRLKQRLEYRCRKARNEMAALIVRCDGKRGRSACGQGNEIAVGGKSRARRCRVDVVKLWAQGPVVREDAHREHPSGVLTTRSTEC